jgi:hypothetical protein
MAKQEDKYFLEIVDLIDREFYDFYRDNRTHQALAIDQYNYFKKAVGGMFQVIKKITSESSGGLDIKDFGYFCYVRSKNKRKSNLEKNPLKKHLKKYRIDLRFFPREDFKDWYLEPNSIYFPKLNQYFVTPESANMKYEMEAYNRKISSEAKNIKFIK